MKKKHFAYMTLTGCPFFFIICFFKFYKFEKTYYKKKWTPCQGRSHKNLPYSILRYSLLLAFLIINIKSNAQVPDSVRVIKDTIPKATPSVVKASDSLNVKKKFIPVPKKALLYSIIPGGGQIYNRKWAYLKLPVVYGAIGGGVFAIQFNSVRYRYLKTAYYNKVNLKDVSPSKLFPYINNFSPANIKQARDAYFKQLQQSYAITSIIYILSGIEAFTAAHLMNFDISDDLTMQVKPHFNSLPYGNTAGIGLAFSIK